MQSHPNLKKTVSAKRRLGNYLSTWTKSIPGSLAFSQPHLNSRVNWHFTYQSSLRLLRILLTPLKEKQN